MLPGGGAATSRSRPSPSYRWGHQGTIYQCDYLWTTLEDPSKIYSKREWGTLEMWVLSSFKWVLQGQVFSCKVTNLWSPLSNQKPFFINVGEHHMGCFTTSPLPQTEGHMMIRAESLAWDAPLCRHQVSTVSAYIAFISPSASCGYLYIPLDIEGAISVPSCFHGIRLGFSQCQPFMAYVITYARDSFLLLMI